MDLLYTLVKKDFNFARDVPAVLVQNADFFIVPAFVYPVMVHYGRKCDWLSRGVAVMPPSLNRALFLWNCALSCYSMISLYYLSPVLWSVINNGYKYTVCAAEYRFEPWGRWLLVFLLSKVVEFGDTVFMILRGKTVPFLHWYHHLATLGLTYIQCLRLARGMELAAMFNLSVHSWMYLYYAMSSFRKGSTGNKALTGLQIAQMFHGIYICVYKTVYCGESADVPALTVYAVYAWLFAAFYTQRYHQHPKLP